MLATLTDSPVFARHTLDAPYRACSWALDAWANVWMHEAAPGQQRAWAVVQGPWHTLDYATHPDHTATLWPELWAWAQARARTIATRRGKPLTLFVEVHPDHPVAHQVVAGAAQVAYHRPHLVCPLNAAPPASPAPAGFTVRPLRGEAEAAAYVAVHRAAFNSTNMTLEWRQRTLLHPAHVPALDLVAEAPDGRLAGFVMGWQLGSAVMVEPLGILPEFHQRGLGRALVTALKQAALARGARTLHVEPYDNDTPALAFYRALGFAPQFQWVGYEFGR